MRKTTLDEKLRDYIQFFLPFCPACGRDGVKAGTAGMLDSPLNLRRWTQRGAALECRKCGFRLSFRWEALRNMLSKRIELDCAGKSGEDKTKCMNFYGRPRDYIQFFLDLREKGGESFTK